MCWRLSLRLLLDGGGLEREHRPQWQVAAGGDGRCRGEPRLRGDVDRGDGPLRLALPPSGQEAADLREGEPGEGDARLAADDAEAIAAIERRDHVGLRADARENGSRE